MSLISFLLAAVRYLSIRARLSDVIDIPDYLDRIHEHPDLCVSFKEWLERNRLMPRSSRMRRSPWRHRPTKVPPPSRR